MENQVKKKIQLPCEAELLLIHRPPMLLIDTLVERGKDDATAVATISDDSIFFDEQRGIFPEYFIEIMAQTMAAANGYDHHIKNTPLRDGFFVGLDKFILDHLPAKEKTFTVKIVKTLEFGSMQILEGEVFAGNLLVASGELKVWEQNENEK